MKQTSTLQHTFFNLDRRWMAIAIGLTVGVVGGLLGLSLAVLGAVPTVAIVFGLMVGLYVLTDVHIALYVAVSSLLLLPFGTLPFSIGVTPTFLDLALAAFLLVYLVRRMTRQVSGFQLTPVHGLLALYIMWVIFAFVLGLQYGNPTSTVLRRFAETLLALFLPFLLVDLIREPETLKRLLRLMMWAVAIQAVIALVLFLLPDTTTENLLVRLARIGYPNGGVVRYIESNPELGERAIGTWVDPNALGGILAVSAMLIAPQIIAKRPLIRRRWISASMFFVTAAALYLTNSRASFLALGFGIGVIVLLRYRRFIPILLLASSLFLFLPQTQNYIDRIFQAFQGEDLSTQMRIGEWNDALDLITRYPLAGIGFTGTPFRNVYTDVANMYLIMANQIGLTGVFFFLLAMGGVMAYGLRAWQSTRLDDDLEAIHLGLHLALATGLINAVADLYFFRLDFQSSITYFWLIVALCLCVSRMGFVKASAVSALPNRAT